ncbi:MAG: hypothetical protein ACTSQD_00835 [Promethearchaeota archaeon]
MSIILRIPDLVDQSLAGINQQLSSLQTRMNTLSNDIGALKTRGMTSPVGPSSLPGAPPPPGPGSLPGAPPPPPSPSGPPGGPPGGPAPGPSRPASPVSLRGAIMGELKSLFAKRKAQ